ncbi:MAG TPA: carboxypeptidase regulatory-like domain-containing protein [Bacteroidota bacterium]|nr:carboxypeptidase regulatory-like domain-containing protein [Bacteroidota bacterium]
MKNILSNSGAMRFVTPVMFLLIFGSLLFCQTGYTPKEVRDGGTITGKVLLDHPPKQIDRMEISQDTKACGMVKQSCRLVVGKDRGVANAIVYLEGVSSGKKFSNDKPCLLAQRNCEYCPHIMVVPAGSKLNIVNEDAVLHSVHSYTTENFQSVFNIAQPVKGLKSCTKSLDHCGLMVTKCDAGHPWMSGYIMVAKHPYYVVTDNDGNFSLDNIPPGTYTLHMWHEGVAITNKDSEHGKVKSYTFEKAYEQTQQVTISPKSTATVDFTLILR